MKAWQKKWAAAAALGICMTLSVTALARPHGGVNSDGTAEAERQHTTVEVERQHANQTVDLAVNMDVDGLHPKYSNRVPESWHPMENVDWQVKEQDSPQPLNRWPVTVEDSGGVLLFSDSPEYVEQDGILYTDVVEGDGRIFYYHLNNTRRNKKIAVVAESTDGYTSVLNITRSALSQPSDNYLQVGKSAQEMFMSSQDKRDVIIFPHRRKVLDDVMSNTIVRPGQLVNGIYDFHATRPVRLTVVMCDANTDPVAFAGRAKVLPKDEHRLRGTYQGMNRIIRGTKVYDPLHDGAVFIPLADNTRDVYRKGIDATDGSETENYGNYGVMYQLQIPVSGKGEIQYMLNPLGGVYAGAMTVQLQGEDRKFLLSVPRNKLFFGDKAVPSYTQNRFPATENRDYIYYTSELANLGAYKASETVNFEFSPPGASNLPVNFIIMPATQAQGLAYRW